MLPGAVGVVVSVVGASLRGPPFKWALVRRLGLCMAGLKIVGAEAPQRELRLPHFGALSDRFKVVRVPRSGIFVTDSFIQFIVQPLSRRLRLPHIGA